MATPPVISIRPDRDVEEALQLLGDTYGNRTATLKVAILRLAKEQQNAALHEEALNAAADPDDLAETRTIMAIMDDLRA